MTKTTSIPPPNHKHQQQASSSSSYTANMALRLTIQQFLQTAKQSFLAAIKDNRPDKVMIVSGNQSADLDSCASAILYSYISEFSPSTSPQQQHQQPDKPIYLPLINIPQDEVDLRPELLHLATSLSFTPSDMFFLDDLPSTPLMDKVPWTLVDHCARTGPLYERFGQRGISGIIDHHEDEGFALEANPRIIEPTGSCCSHVTNYLAGRWDELGKTLPGDINTTLVKMAMVPVVIDTANMISKVTPHDTTALDYLKSKNTGVDSDSVYAEFKAAKNAIDDFPMRDLLRKDYKEYENPNGCTVGISSIGRSLSWMAERDGQSFVTALDNWATERKLECLCIVCNNAGIRGENYKRYVLIRGIAGRTEGVARQFELQGKDELQLSREALKGIDFGNGGEDGGSAGVTMCWEQGDLEKSRKQVAPLLRGICAALE